ncbi:cyclic nucleotide-binding domain-containing protein [Bosea sp. BK604]|uniref:cyclic nucleotide-binding domain-containing protein n=1 Tax=Bosea sp. BK604 TaxID=2512180 RepID=UPI0010483F0B|nr:cyclic nucleotide-binding domain-containing protein [Bosea sp. BK604]TCR66140.1 putative ABC transport system ATP-binding protein [Bosea sp. BK604]
MVELFSYIWRNSRREQVKILAIVLVSFPFYYLSLDLPKYIITDAIQGRAFPDGVATARLLHVSVAMPAWLGGGQRELFAGLTLERTSYLFALSLLFLLLVLINGAFKYVINMRKGALGERLLQRLRFDLFAALLNVAPEARRHLKPSEAATVIKDEVEPIGGFVGDAFVQPVLLGGQALTALAFILLQNLALGLIAAAIVGLQAVIIPHLRREQIRLGKQRQLASRALAGKIGEVVEGLGEVANHGTSAAERNLVAERLETLFGIRYQLYGRKFAVKFLNNLLAQVTPFLFYTIGGYFALSGRLDIGQLVAVIAAYRDLPTPIKELIDWDQQRLDVEARFQQVNRHFALEMRPALPDAAPERAPVKLTEGAIAAKGLTVLGATGDRVLDRISLTLPLGAHVALIDRSGERASTFAQLLGGTITVFDGSVTLAGLPLGSLSPELRGRSFAYLGPEPVIFDGSLRDNILYGLRRANGEAGTPWALDLEGAGLTGPEELERRLVEILTTVGLADTVFRFGLQQRLSKDEPSAIAGRIAELRARIRAKLIASGAGDAVEPFDPDRYTHHAPIGDNILFGVATDPAWSDEELASNPTIRKILDDLDLTPMLTRIGQRIAATMIEIFRDLPADHVLFERFSFITAEQFDDYRDIVARSDAAEMSERDRSRLIALAFRYTEPRHRLGLLRRVGEQRILDARHALRAQAGPALAEAIAFYDPEQYCAAAPLRDNLLFGCVASGGRSDNQRTLEAMRESLAELGLEHEVYRKGLERQAGYGGQSLFPGVKVAVALARCLIKHPQMLILNEALAPFGETEAGRLLARVRSLMKGRTLLVAGRQSRDFSAFDASVEFHAAGSVSSASPAIQTQALPDIAEPGEETGAENEELRALRSVPIFAEIDTPRLRLLAFTAERITFAAGDVIFRQGDESDAAYLVIEGSADVVTEASGSPVLISTMTGHSLFGEMGIVTGEPRSATIIAATALTALRLRKTVFTALLTEFPSMALSVTRLMVRRLQDNVAALSRRE